MGAYLAEKEAGITDPEILDAIRYHTSGRPGMTLLDKVIYVADYIEPAIFPEWKRCAVWRNGSERSAHTSNEKYNDISDEKPAGLSGDVCNL